MLTSTSDTDAGETTDGRETSANDDDDDDDDDDEDDGDDDDGKQGGRRYSGSSSKRAPPPPSLPLRDWLVLVEPSLDAFTTKFMEHG